MPLEGSVDDFGLVDIVQLIAVQKKAGVLKVSCKGKADVLVYFCNGTFIRAFYGDENDRFADAMISSERITVAQLRTALRTCPQGASIVETFIKLNYITTQEAMRFHQMLTQEVLFDLLSWKTGSYKFNQESVAIREYDNAVSVEHILMEGMRQSDEWPALIKKIPSRDEVYEKVEMEIEEIVPGERPLRADLRVTEETEFPQTSDAKETKAAGLMKYINGSRSVNEIMNLAGIGAFPVYKELAQLLSDGIIKIAAPKAKIEKKALFKISFGGIKEIAFHPIVLNGFIICSLAILSGLFFYLNILREKSIEAKAHTGPIQAWRALSAVSNKDIIAFSLNLYYLQQNRFPDTLRELQSEGYLDQSISLEDFVYSADKSNFILNVRP